MRPTLLTALALAVASGCAFDTTGPADYDLPGDGKADGPEQGGDDVPCELWPDFLPAAPGTRLHASVDECGPIVDAELTHLDHHTAAIRLRFAPAAGDWASGVTSLDQQHWQLTQDQPGLCGNARVRLVAHLSDGRGLAIPVVLEGVVRPRTDSDLVIMDFPGARMTLRRGPLPDDLQVTFSASAGTAAALASPPPLGYGVHSTCGVSEDGSVSRTFRYRFGIK